MSQLPFVDFDNYSTPQLARDLGSSSLDTVTRAAIVAELERRGALMKPVRVQVPAYTDAWMKGDRFGTVVKITNGKRVANQVRTALLTKDRRVGRRLIAHVKMDKSGKTLRFVYDDCQDVS